MTSRKKMIYVVIPLTHHKNSGYTEFKVLGVYLFVHGIVIMIYDPIVRV